MINGIIFCVSCCLVVKKIFRICLRKDLEYPLGFNALKRVLVASSKSVFCVQILLNLSNCDLIRPLKVCLGWRLFLCKSACVSVSLKNTFVSKVYVWGNDGPLYVVVSKKSMCVLCVAVFYCYTSMVCVKDLYKVFEFF